MKINFILFIKEKIFIDHLLMSVIESEFTHARKVRCRFRLKGIIEQMMPSAVQKYEEECRRVAEDK